MNSKLYAGQVMHARTLPRTYRFKYGVYYLYIDLDEIDEVDRRISVLSYNRFNIMSLLDRDHLGAQTGQGMRTAVREHLTARGVDLEGATIALLTNTRILNYVFNPVSFYFVRDRCGMLTTVLAEVHNTHGERHIYDLDRVPSDGSAVYASRAEKAFYVSPFIEMDARYEFSFKDLERGAMDIRIDEFRGDDLFFKAQLKLRPLPLTNANVLKMLARFPLITLKTIGLIHWQGLKLWLRGVPYLRHTPRERAVKP